MNRVIPIAAAALMLAGGLFYLQSGPQPTLTPLGMAEAQAAEGEVDTSLVEEMVLGAEDAPLTVIEYASFTCPHCKDFHQETFKEFKANYIDTGKVRFVYREVYFDRFGLWAGMVARCGGADKYFPIANLIYAQQPEWTAGGSPAEIAGNLAKIGRTAGLGADQVDACLQDAKTAQALVAVYEETTAADGIRSTPSFIIDGDLVTGNKSYEEFATILDAKLGE